jgi:hypothetical protein
VNGEYAIYKSGTHEFDFDAEQPNGINGFNVFQAHSRTGAASIARLSIDVGGMQIWDETGLSRLFISAGTTQQTYAGGLGGTGNFTVFEHDPNSGLSAGRLIMGSEGVITFYRSPGSDFSVQERAAGGGSVANRFSITDTYDWFQWPGTNSRLVIMPPIEDITSRPDISGRVQMVNHYGYGAQIRFLSTSTGTSNRVDITDAGGAGYVNLTAGTYTNGSSITSKSDVRKFAGDPLDIVRRSELTAFRRKGQMMLKGKRAPDGPIEHGFIAEHLPVEMVTVDENDVRVGVNMMAAVGFAFGGIQKVADSVDELTKRIEALEAKK